MHLTIRSVSIFFDTLGAKIRVVSGEVLEVETLVVLHGGPGIDHVSIKSFFQPFTEFAQILFIDYRGTGRSSISSKKYWTIKEWAKDLHDLCIYLGIKHPIILGHSFGAYVAACYSMLFPTHVKKLILTSPILNFDPNRIARNFLNRSNSQKIEKVARNYWKDPTPENWKAYKTHCYPFYSTQILSTHYLQKRWNTIETNENVLFHFIRGEARQIRLQSYLQEVNCPTRIIIGQEDVLCPIDDHNELARMFQLKDIDTISIPDAGHFIFVDAFQSVSSEIISFLV